MAVSAGHVPVAASTAPMDPEEERAFFQERLGVFAMWCCILGGAFYAVNVALAYPEFTGADGAVAGAFTPTALFHLLGVITVGVVWVLTRIRQWPLGVLRGFDAAGLITCCTSYGLMGLTAIMGPGASAADAASGLFSAMLACTNVVLARAVIVPSTAARTVALSLIALLPLEVGTAMGAVRTASTLSFAVAIVVSTVAWALVAVVVATVGSRVVYGLRRERERIKRLGQYTLEEKIGEGAMGVVYRASHVLLRRPTAIKLLPPERAGEENVKRFEREVQLTARLTHPNTVAIYDYGRTPQGVFYCAMELLPGLDLAALVREYGPQPAGRVIRFLQQVCGSLAEAHAAGLVHRDIKPANLILTQRGGEPDIVKVVDFGIVKRLDLRGVEATEVTTAVLAGTPLCIPPEAIKSEDLVDARSDIYSLGCVAYFLLTGHYVFEGESVLELCAHHLHTVPVPPSRRAAAGVPPDLEAVVLTCLEKSQDARYPDVRALQDALGRCADAGAWSREDAVAWWKARGTAPRPGPEAEPVPREAQTVAVDLVAR